MSLPDECRHWTTPRWLSCIYERLLSPFAVSGDISVANFPNYKLPPYTRRTFTTTDGNITRITYFDGATQVATRVLAYSAGSIVSDTLSLP